MRTNILLSGAAAAMAGALAVWGCGGSGGYGGSSPTASTPAPTAPSPTPGAVTVSIVGSAGNQAFRPNPVSADSGQTLVFTNSDTTTHHIVLDDGSADLGELAPGATSRAVTVRSASAVNYHCLLHPSMVGSINGQTAPQPPPCNDPYGYGCS
jgi:plastocyanin